MAWMMAFVMYNKMLISWFDAIMFIGELQFILTRDTPVEYLIDGYYKNKRYKKKIVLIIKIMCGRFVVFSEKSVLKCFRFRANSKNILCFLFHFESSGFLFVLGNLPE